MRSSQGFGDHLEETRQHVENLKLAFEELGEPAKAEKCPGIEGIKKEHDEFVANESPTPEVLDAFLTGAVLDRALRDRLLRGPDHDGRRDGRDQGRELLTENLEQEQTALTKMKTIGKRLAKDGAKASV